MAGLRYLAVGGVMALVTGLADARPALADGSETRACLNAHVAGQRLRKDQRLIEARSTLIQCARDGCPAVTIDECGRWLQELEREIPSVVFEARSAGGSDVTDFTATLDGRSVALPRPGHPLELDPGPKRFRFERRGFAPVEETVVVALGDQKRRVAISFAPLRKPSERPVAEAAPGGAQDRPVPASVYAVGALGLVAAGVAIGFGVYGFSGLQDLDACKPNCAEGSVAETRGRFIVADVAGAVAVGALVAGAYLFLTRPATATGSRGVSVAVQPARVGATAIVSLDL